MRSTHLVIDEINLAGHDDWVALPLEPVADDDALAVLGPLVAPRCAGPDAVAVLVPAVATLQRSLVADLRLAIVVWLPDVPAGVPAVTAVPAVMAVAVVDLVVPEPGWSPSMEDLCLVALEEGARTDVVRQWRDVSVVDDIPAGPTVLTHEVSARVEAGQQQPLEEIIVFLVRPPGTEEMLRLSVSTPHLERSDDFREGALAIAEHLRVGLVPAS